LVLREVYKSRIDPVLPENKRGGLIIDGYRFGLPLGFCASSSAETRTSGKQSGYDEKGNFENGP
jgi:hypothetical protein